MNKERTGGGGQSNSNFENKTIWTGDNLPIMRGINDACIDLVYLDPPFNSDANYAAPIGSKAAGAEFKDTWTLDDIDDEWINSIAKKHPKLYQVLIAAMTDSDKSYLAYMSQRILEIYRILKDTGSIYLHCDPTMSHYLKLVMDTVFGRDNFRNEIIWHYGKWSNSGKMFQRNHDTILFYTKSDDYTFNPLYVERRNPAPYNIQGGKVNQLLIYRPEDTPQEIIEREKEKGRKIIYVEQPGPQEHDVWTYVRDDTIDFIPPRSSERTGYRTQKPLALLKRIIEASSNPGDLVFDPFCGCATTLVAADGLNHPRNWAGIDISPKAVELVIDRIKNAQGIFKDIKARVDIPERDDLGRLPSPRSHLNHLYGAQGGYCKGCGEHYRKGNLEVDHIVAKAKGGNDHLNNLQLLCGECNRKKGSRDMAYLMNLRNKTKEILELV